MSMKTDDLIESLSADLPKIAPGAVARRVALGLGLGGLNFIQNIGVMTA